MRVPMRGTGADQPVGAKKSRNGDGAKGLDRPASPAGQPGTGGAGPAEAKPFCISKKVVWEAYKRVKANKGAAGVDGETIADFERDLKKNLYKIWNRMSSGSYFPPPVRRVEIPKKGDETQRRPLGVPAVSDRIAQMVCKLYLEPKVEPYFHVDSYGYRQEKSAIEAVGVARKRCWKYDWVLDLDVKSFFDTLDHALLLKALRKHTDCKWILLYVERWLKAPVQWEDGTQETRDKGSPQGSVISPLLANLFLHYAFDKWMERHQPSMPFERFADDIICHCKSEAQAEWLRSKIAQRFAECHLELHPEKTRIVYCKDARRKGKYRNVRFEFLGFSFQPRWVGRPRSGRFIGFTPAVGNRATKAIRDVIRSWRLHLQSPKSLEELSRKYNPIIRGWVNYYGSYFRSALYKVFNPLNLILAKWAMRKYKRFRGHQRRAARWLLRIRKRDPQLFAHWQLAPKPAAGR